MTTTAAASVIGSQEKPMQVTVAPNSSTSAVDPATANGAASEVELSKQTEHSGENEVLLTVVVDTSYSPTGFKDEQVDGNVSST